MLSALDTVDLVVTTPTGAKKLVLVVEEGEWEREDRIFLLQEKLNAYATFALDGEMYERYPGSEGVPVTIILTAVQIPQEEDVEDFVRKVKPLLEADGLAFEVECPRATLAGSPGPTHPAKS